MLQSKASLISLDWLRPNERIAHNKKSEWLLIAELITDAQIRDGKQWESDYFRLAQ